MSKQPRDDGNDPIPVLSFRPHTGQKIYYNYLGSTRSAAFAPSVRVISVYSTSDAFFEVGNADVIANSDNSHFLPGGLYIDISLGPNVVPSENYKYLAVTSLDNEGTIFISERE